MQTQAERAQRGAGRWLSRVAATASVLFIAQASSAFAAHPVKGGTYTAGEAFVGRTSVSFTVSRRGTSLRDIVVTTSSRCSNGRKGLAILLGPLLEPPARLRVSPAGSFSGTFVPRNPALPSPFEASEQYAISGRFTRRTAARIVVHTRLVGEAGTVCDSGDRPVTARLERRRHGSSTG